MILVIFDLDGVIVSTDRFHFAAWKALADEHGLFFDEKMNHKLRGVSRSESLGIILSENKARVSEATFEVMLEKKNHLYRSSLEELNPKDILPGVESLLSDLKNASILRAIGSSSRNTPLILKKIGLEDSFDVVIDGNSITRSKPHPEVFLKCASALSVNPEDCLVVEDAQAGVDAAAAAGMAVLGVGTEPLKGADKMVKNLQRTETSDLRHIWESRV